MNCNTCKMCESADKRLESFVASKAGEFETAFQIHILLFGRLFFGMLFQTDHVE